MVFLHSICARDLKSIFICFSYDCGIEMFPRRWKCQSLYSGRRHNTEDPSVVALLVVTVVLEGRIASILRVASQVVRIWDPKLHCLLVTWHTKTSQKNVKARKTQIQFKQNFALNCDSPQRIKWTQSWVFFYVRSSCFHQERGWREHKKKPAAMLAAFRADIHSVTGPH